MSALESSGAVDASIVARQHVATPENGPASPPSSLDERNCSQDQPIQQQQPLSRVLELLDVNLLNAPYTYIYVYIYIGAAAPLKKRRGQTKKLHCKCGQRCRSLIHSEVPRFSQLFHGPSLAGGRM